MKEIIKEYKNIFFDFFRDKRYSIVVILIGILSYGFTITNYSIGLDDLCFDRYVEGTYILSANRWGTWLLYNVLHITKFSPFWLDFIVAMLMVFTATLICTAMKKVLKDKVSIWAYTLFTGIFLSNPIIGQFFIYQSTNLSVVVSNIIGIISAIILIENMFTAKKKWMFILVGEILIFAFSMYEASVQSFFAMLFILLLIKVRNETIGTKDVLEVLAMGIASTIIGIIGYEIIGKIINLVLDKMQIGVKDYALHSIRWLNVNFWNVTLKEKIFLINEILVFPLFEIITRFFPATILAITSLISIIFGIRESIKERKDIILPLLGVIFSSFLLIVVQGMIMYRVQFSWTITVAFLCMYIFVQAKKIKSLKYIVAILLIWLIIIQTNTLNDFFYNEYRRFEREKVAAYEIARDIKNCENYQDKTIVYIAKERVPNQFYYPIDNKTLVLQWGTYAFDEMRNRNNQIYKQLWIQFSIQ